MAKHGRLPAPPPIRRRAATASAAAAPLARGFLAASARTVGAAASVTHHKADFHGEGCGHVTSAVGNATASGQKDTCDLPGGTAIADPAASSYDRWGAALTASDINSGGCPMFAASASN
ncbi:hypothetical protein [Streptomyces longispororuber]|uniref:hypothetical protein n=1 Tax=Streptomyces longispororuber TaxID=68230 RepID=UPI00210DDC1E|nr:hypothetical protein [Streptomyces longispororuber]MCQ4206940.1 hypothetical protein [Streptomyces longispororuber]